MLGLILSTLILAFVSVLSSFAVLLRILLPVVYGSTAFFSRRGAYGANPQKTFADLRSSFGGSIASRRPSDVDWNHGRRGSGADSLLAGPARLRSAQRVQVWLAIFDIISTAFLIASWIAVATTSHPTWTSYPPSPFYDGQTAALMAIALCLRPILLSIVSVMSLAHVRLGRSSYLGKLDWGLWATTSLFTVGLSIITWLVFHFAPRRAATRVITGLLVGLNAILLVTATMALLGLMWTIYQAKIAFRIALHASKPYPAYEHRFPSTTTINPPVAEKHKEHNSAPTLPNEQLIEDVPGTTSDRGTFGQHAKSNEPTCIDGLSEAFNFTVPVSAEAEIHLGTVTTTTGGAMSAVAGSAVPSSADPYHMAMSNPASTQKGTISTARSQHTGPLRGSLSKVEATMLTPMPESDQELPGFQQKARLNSDVSATSKTHGFFSSDQYDRRPSGVSMASGASSGNHEDRPLPYGPNNKSRKSLREVLDDISRSVHGVDVNDWRHSLSQIRVAGSALSEDDATTLHQPSPRQSAHPETVLPQVPEVSSSGVTSSHSSAISPTRIRREVEEQVDRMFAEVGLSNFIKDKWREIVPTGSLPLVRSPNLLSVETDNRGHSAERGWQRASTHAQLQTVPFATKLTAQPPASPMDMSYIPHTYDPNFDGTFSRSAETGDSPSHFSTTGIRCVRPDATTDRSAEQSSEPRTVPIFSRTAAPRSGTFGHQDETSHHAVSLRKNLPGHAATVNLRPSQPSPLRNTLDSAVSQTLSPHFVSRLREPYFNPAFLAPTAHQLGFIHVPPSHSFPSFGARPSDAPGRSSSAPFSDAASELVQAVQGGGDDALGAQSALVRIASHATLRAAVQRVEFDLSHEEDRLAKEAQIGLNAAVAHRSVKVAEQNQRLHALKQAQWQEERMSNRETKVALLRLSGHLLSLWLPFVLSMPYLLYAAAQPRAVSAPFILPLLFSLSLTLCGPLSLFQTIIIHGSGLATLTSWTQGGHPLQSNSGRSSTRSLSAQYGNTNVNSSEHTLLATTRKSPQDPRLQDFSVRIERADSGYVDDRVRSVPYRREHWTAGEVVGDRVARPRSALLRGLSLIFETHPRLEVLPFQAEPEAASRRVRLPNSSVDIMNDGGHSRIPSFEQVNLDIRRNAAGPNSEGRHSAGIERRAPSSHPRSRNGTTHSGTGTFQLDGLSAMLLPRIVPGLSIGPDVAIADDDEQTLVEEYQSFYRRYLSDLPDIFNLNSARQAFQEARRSILRRVNVRPNPARAATAWNIAATNVSTPNATGGYTDPGDDSVHSFTTAAEASEAEEARINPLGPPSEPEAERNDLQADEDASRRPVFNWTPQPAQVSPPRLPVGRSSSVSIEVGKTLAGHSNVTTRSRQGRHRRDATSLPDAKPEVLAQFQETEAHTSMTASTSMPLGLHGVSTPTEDPRPLPQPPASPPAADTSLNLSVNGREESHRRSLASDLGLASARRSLGSEMGLESVGSGRQRKSLSSDFGLLLAALREQKEDSPASSKRLTSDSVSSTIMSEEISLSSPSRHEETPARSLLMHSSPPAPQARAKMIPEPLSSSSIVEESVERSTEEMNKVETELQTGNQGMVDVGMDQLPSEEELAEAVHHMDPLTLHRYLHPAIPLETLDEVTEEMTNDLTRSLDAIWTRSQRDSFMSTRRNAVDATPVKMSLDDVRSELGIDTPRSAVGQFGYAYIARRNALADVHAAKSSTGSTKLSDPPAGDLAVSAFDSSVWISSAPATLAFSLPQECGVSQRTRTASSVTASTIGFEREAEWVENEQAPWTKKGKGKDKGTARKRRSLTQHSDISNVKRTSFNTSSSSASSSRSSTTTIAAQAMPQTVPDSPWAVVAPRGEADFTITSPPPLLDMASAAESENWGSMVNQRIRRYEQMTEETPCKPGLKKSPNGATSVAERPALQDKTNQSATGQVTGGQSWAFPRHSSPTTSPHKHSSFPAILEDDDSHVASTYAQPASLGRKSARTSASIPAIHVRAPSDSSAMSFYHF
ncbi:hypothetical protein OC835_000537 [Tilletia horrida]|nr:hypothetical protein OC835_000537 [Tilletia horrida]